MNPTSDTMPRRRLVSRLAAAHGRVGEPPRSPNAARDLHDRALVPAAAGNPGLLLTQVRMYEACNRRRRTCLPTVVDSRTGYWPATRPIDDGFVGWCELHAVADPLHLDECERAASCATHRNGRCPTDDRTYGVAAGFDG